MSNGTARPPAAASLSESLGFPETVVEVGMTHPGVRHTMTSVGGTTSFVVQLDDDRIRDLEVEIGLGHRGFEKEVESIPWARALPYVARLGYAGGVIAETAFCLAVEERLGWTLPDRAVWMRMLANELARVTDHCARLASVMSAIGLGEAEAIAQQAEVEASRLLRAAVMGAPLAGWNRLGGVASGLPAGFAQEWLVTRASLEKAIVRFESVGVSNPTCLRRLRDVGALGAEDCQSWGVTGPVLRAAGFPGDVRKDRPYLAYAALDFEIPIGESGDDLDRLLVVVEEIRQSLSMVEQCQKLLASLGPGAIALDVHEVGFEAPGSVASAEETRERGSDFGPHRHVDLEVPVGESVASVESSTGELSFFVVSDGEGPPRRIRCRAPSFFHAQALPQMMRGARLDDLLPTVALLHLVSGECDR